MAGEGGICALCWAVLGLGCDGVPVGVLGWMRGGLWGRTWRRACRAIEGSLASAQLDETASWALGRIQLTFTKFMLNPRPVWDLFRVVVSTRSVRHLGRQRQASQAAE